MKVRQLIDHPALRLEPHVGTAIVRTVEAFQPLLWHPPVPVRFDSSGALRAWQPALSELSNAGARHNPQPKRAFALARASFTLMMCSSSAGAASRIISARSMNGSGRQRT